MTADEIKHFLVIHDTATGGVEIERFGGDYEAALAAYGEAERANAENDRYDIVLLSADSLATLKKTHGSYFSAEASREAVAVR